MSADRLFPYREMFNWLSYYNGRVLLVCLNAMTRGQDLLMKFGSCADPSAPKEVVNNDRTLFQRREFSFTLADDIYVRHRSFVDAVRVDVCRCLLMPIGAYFLPCSESSSLLCKINFPTR